MPSTDLLAAPETGTEPSTPADAALPGPSAARTPVAETPSTHTAAPHSPAARTHHAAPGRTRLRVALGRRPRGRHLPPSSSRRPGLYVTAAAAGALLVGAVSTGSTDAQAGAPVSHSVSVAQQLGLSAATSPITDTAVRDRAGAQLGELAASRSQREGALAAAARAQADSEAQARAAQQAAQAAAAQAAADAQARAAAAAQTPENFKRHALEALGGDRQQFSCLESLWGKESGWNPHAQNRSSTAYGIPQFLNSTWGLVGVAKTDDGFRQVDAGLTYIDRAYGSPCNAWAHSRALNWY